MTHFKTSLKGLFLATLFSGVILSGCSKKATDGQSAATNNGKKVFKYGNGAEPKDLDPHIVTGVPENHILTALFEGLVTFDPPTLEARPGMAASWDISKDLTKYTFKIRKDAKWSNGDKFTAHDMVYSWKRVLSPALGSEYAYMLYVLKNGEAYNKGDLKDFSKVGVKATDDHTLEVTLNAATPYFLSLLFHYSTWPVHKGTIEKFGKFDERGTKWTRPGNIVSNGPYTLKNWELNKILTVEKNPKYWNAKVTKIDEIQFFPIENLQTEERMFRSGELHKTNVVPAHKIAKYKTEKAESLYLEPYLGTYYYRFNVTKAPLNDPKVRRALAISIDRQKIVDKVTKAGEVPATSFVPPNTAGYTSKHKITENIQEAKKLLAEAGFPEGKGFPTIEILYNTQDTHKAIAVALQQMWKVNLGVNISIKNQDWKVYLDSQKRLDYDISRAGWIGDYTDPNTFMDMWVKDGGNNQTGWYNDQYDALIAKAAITSDPEKRYEIFQQAEAILMKELPIMPIYTYTNKYLLDRSKIKGWATNILDWNLYQYLDLEI